MASRQSGKRKLAAAEDRTEEANTKRAREDSSTIHPQNPLLACNHCGCDVCAKLVSQKNARSKRKSVMLSQQWRKRGRQGIIRAGLTPQITQNADPNHPTSSTLSSATKTVSHQKLRTMPKKNYDCGCTVCSEYVRCKNARAMRRAIIQSKRLSKKQDQASTSTQVFSRPQVKIKKALMAKENPILECPYCKALVWYSESSGTDFRTGEPTYTICCQQGRVKLPPVKNPPPYLQSLHANSTPFRNNIRVYNSMLAFTSVGANIDHSITSGNGPPAYRIHGQLFHRIGSLIPMPGKPPQFLQMWIVDTDNELTNRMKTMPRRNPSEALEEDIIIGLTNMLDENNCLSKFFRKARDRYKSNECQDLTIRLVGQKGKGRQYDLPQISEVAGLILGDVTATVGYRDVVLELQSNHLQEIRDDHPLFMSLQYPLLFPYGEYGFHTEIPHAVTQNGETRRTFISVRDYYAYQIHTRLSEGMTIIKGGRLLHQYVVDAYTVIEQERLQWIRNNQDELRADLYNNVFDAVGKGLTDAKQLGKRIILPSSFTGGPRYMVEKYHDAMSICRTYGNPNLFITMTANPNWPEIKDHLTKYGGLSANDRPDIEGRVFKMKLDQLFKDLEKGTFFSPCIAVIYTIEFQKRGLPHAHMLLWLENAPKIPEASDINAIISAELPNKTEDPLGFALVERHMMHGPCGKDRPSSPCMSNQVCTKKYPRKYTDSTTVDKSGYIIYRRRQEDPNFVLKGTTRLDNRFVIPHNMDILKKYQSHINVEWCNTTNAIKYLFKYITKGVDKATIMIEKGKETLRNEKDTEHVVYERDEIQEFIDCRYLSACESMWRTFAFHIHKRKPAVQKLIIHLENQQSISYKRTSDLGRVLTRYGIEKTMFTEWMAMNAKYPEARELLYVEFPKYYVWNNDAKVWHKRKQGHTIGRIVTIHPSAGDLYYLRILVNIIRGATSFEDFYKVNGEVKETLKEACRARGLLENDKEWHKAMDQASNWATPHQLRHLFVTLLIYCEISNPVGLWEHCWKLLSEDILNKKRREFGFEGLHLEDEDLSQYTLLEIEKLLNQHEKSLTDFKPMPTPDLSIIKELGNSLLNQEYHYNIKHEKEEHERNYILLNSEQKKAYEAVLNSIDNNLGQLFFLNGAGGTGKTFLYKTIISKLRSIKKVVLPVASSGIAALLLPGGRTAHSRFKIPLQLNEDTMCEIKPGTMLAELLLKTDLIIWDEAPMSHRHTFEALDRTLRDILRAKDPFASNKLFGGINVLLGGDFRQILPVIPQGTRPDTVMASISQSYLWNECNVYVLHENMRLQQSEKEFAEWLVSVGDGTAPKADKLINGKDDQGEIVAVEKRFMMQPAGDPLHQIADAADVLCNDSKTHIEYLTETAIITPRNETVDEINNYMLSQAPGEAREFLSYDSIEKADTIGLHYETMYPPEYLNCLEFPGLPKHKLVLKVGVPIMLLRNINQKEGLCNGTRLIVTHMAELAINAEIVTGGKHVGKKVSLPRIILSPIVSDHPFTLKRRQFPIRVCYAMTINKSQGQSLKSVILYLPKPVFSHGQLYVALSRVTSPEGLRILQEEKDSATGATGVNNIVYKEIFNNIPQL